MTNWYERHGYTRIQRSGYINGKNPCYLCKEYFFHSYFFSQGTFQSRGWSLSYSALHLSIFGIKRVKFSIKSLFPKFYDHWNASAFFILYFNNLQTLRCNECLSKWFLEFIPLVLIPEYGITNAAALEWARQVVLLLLTICWCCSNILTSKIKTYI